METIWTDSLPARDSERKNLLDRLDITILSNRGTPVASAYGGNDAEHCHELIGGWVNDDLSGFASACQSEGFARHGTTFDYIAVYDEQGEQIGEVRS